MNRVDYMQNWRKAEATHRGVCAQETRLLEVGCDLLNALNELDPAAGGRLINLIGEVAERHPLLRLDA